jgi:tRNA nucleotidyltransferase (CCA-adding enzyme)
MRVIISHANADLDALASLVCARKLYGDAVCVRSQNLSMPVKRYLALHKDRADLRRADKVEADEVEEIVVVDVRDRRRLGEYEAFFASSSRTVVFDHHPASAHDVDADEEHIEPVGACTTLLCEHLQAAGIVLEQWEATLALLGIYADTGSLSFDGTTPRDVDAAAYLLRRGARLSVVNRYMQQRFTPEQRRLLAEMMNQCEEISVDAVEIAISTARARDFIKSAADVVDDVMRMGGHDAIFGVIGFDKGNRVQVVGRSRVPYVNVGALLKPLGGGGHPGAAAASFKNRSLDSVVAEIKDALSAAEFSPTRVADLMSSPVQTIDRAISLAEARDLLARWNFSGAPVLSIGQRKLGPAGSDDASVSKESEIPQVLENSEKSADARLEGIISRRDIERADAAGKLDLPVASHMTHEVAVIAQDEPVEDALELMTRRDVGRLPVFDGARMVGVITRSDILRRLYAR